MLLLIPWYVGIRACIRQSFKTVECTVSQIPLVCVGNPCLRDIYWDIYLLFFLRFWKIWSLDATYIFSYVCMSCYICFYPCCILSIRSALSLCLLQLMHMSCVNTKPVQDCVMSMTICYSAIYDCLMVCSFSCIEHSLHSLHTDLCFVYFCIIFTLNKLSEASSPSAGTILQLLGTEWQWTALHRFKY